MKHLLSFACLVLLFSCEKETTPPQPSQTDYPINPVISAPGARLSFMALKETRFTENNLVKQRFLYGNALVDTKEKVYLVSLNNVSLQLENNAYRFTRKDTLPQGIPLNEVIWKTAQFTYQHHNNFPTIGDIFPDTAIVRINLSRNFYFTINRAHPLTSLAYADSIVYYIHGPLKSIKKSLSADDSAAVFSPAELAVIGTGSAYIQALALNTTYKEINGDNLAFINAAAIVEPASIFP